MSFFPGNLIRFLMGIALGLLLLFAGVRILISMDLILGLIVAVAGVIITSMNITSVISEPCGSLYTVGQRSNTPAPMYSIPEGKRMSGHYEDAILGYEKIADAYPNQLKAYVGMIETSIVYLSDIERAEEFFQKGVAALAKTEDQEALARMFSAIKTRMDVPEPKKKICLKSEQPQSTTNS